jgi:hypothetical protein
VGPILPVAGTVSIIVVAGVIGVVSVIAMPVPMVAVIAIVLGQDRKRNEQCSGADCNREFFHSTDPRSEDLLKIVPMSY